MNLPKYCDFYKFLLVEEVVLPFPEQFHYGKCTTIGQLSLDSDNSIFLNNINISSLERKHQLQDGEIKLRMIWSDCDKVPVYNEPVEVYGEAVFRCKGNRDRDMVNRLPATVKDALLELQTITEPTERDEFWRRINDAFEPSLKVHSLRVITQVDKLVACNLKLRICSQLRDL